MNNLMICRREQQIQQKYTISTAALFSKINVVNQLSELFLQNIAIQNEKAINKKRQENNYSLDRLNIMHSSEN